MFQSECTQLIIFTSNVKECRRHYKDSLARIQCKAAKNDSASVQPIGGENFPKALQQPQTRCMSWANDGVGRLPTLQIPSIFPHRIVTVNVGSFSSLFHCCV